MLRSLRAVSITKVLVQPLMYDYPRRIDAAVMSTDLETGQTIAWQDSVVVGRRGQVDHVFRAEFLPSFGRDYRIEVARSDGARTTAVARVPEKVDVSAVADAERNLHILITGEDFHLLKLDVVYEFHAYRQFTNGCEDDSLFLSRNRLTHAFPYAGREKEIEGGFRVRVRLAFDYLQLETLYIRNPGAAGIALTGMRVHMIVAEPAWSPPGGVFDPNVVSDPSVMTNTTNGFGLVAGGYNEEQSVYLPMEVILPTRFLDGFIRPPRGGCVNYCSCMG